MSKQGKVGRGGELLAALAGDLNWPGFDMDGCVESCAGSLLLSMTVCIAHTHCWEGGTTEEKRVGEGCSDGQVGEGWHRQRT